jgi:hypothetical protein
MAQTGTGKKKKELKSGCPVQLVILLSYHDAMMTMKDDENIFII